MYKQDFEIGFTDDADVLLTTLARAALFDIKSVTKLDFQLVKHQIGKKRTYQIIIGDTRIGRYYPDAKGGEIILYNLEGVNRTSGNFVLHFKVYGVRLLHYGGCGIISL